MPTGRKLDRHPGRTWSGWGPPSQEHLTLGPSLHRDMAIDAFKHQRSVQLNQVTRSQKVSFRDVWAPHAQSLPVPKAGHRGTNWSALYPVSPGHRLVNDPSELDQGHLMSSSTLRRGLIMGAPIHWHLTWHSRSVTSVASQVHPMNRAFLGLILTLWLILARSEYFSRKNDGVTCQIGNFFIWDYVCQIPDYKNISLRKS